MHIKDQSGGAISTICVNGLSQDFIIIKKHFFRDITMETNTEEDSQSYKIKQEVEI